MSDRDRRGEQRFPTPEGVVVRVKFKNKKQFQSSYIKDISNNGIFLRTDKPRPAFESVTVVLELPDATEVALRGTVVHVVPPGHPSGVVAGMGVQFTNLTAERRAKLEAFLSRYKTIPPRDLVGQNDAATVKPGERASQQRLPVPPAGAAAQAGDPLPVALRLLWLCADATALATCDYYELLGLPADAPTEQIALACRQLHALCDPDRPPPGMRSSEAARMSAIEMILSDIEDCLTDKKRRQQYDAARLGHLK